MKLNWNFQRDGGLLKNSSIREYFLELHILSFDLTAIMDAKVYALFFLILLHKNFVAVVIKETVRQNNLKCLKDEVSVW